MWKQVAYSNLVPKCLWTHTSLSRSKKEIVTPWHRQVWPVSSGVEQHLDKVRVGGSRPPLATMFCKFGLLVIMGAQGLCKPLVGVRSPGGPPIDNYKGYYVLFQKKENSYQLLY